MKISSFKFSLNFLIILSLTFLLLSLILCQNKMTFIIEWNILSINSIPFIMTFILDWMSSIFIFIILTISSAVMSFSISYMSEETFKSRFCMILLLFILSMILLVISPNLITILLGWDGLGLVSFLLVIYYQNLKSYNAGMLTILSNRIGDVALLMSISWMLNHGNWNFLSLLPYLDNKTMSWWICLMLIFASITKSAQIPFSAWLPAAMAAPTPVSTLVHSSTLVTAGIFLMIRFSDFLFQMKWFQPLTLLISSMTMLMASLVAYHEFDIKKIIALSTLSQLGLMMSIMSFGLFYLTIFHLFTHAIFKALLFICAGAIILNFNHFQDIRMIGYISNQMPWISICFNSANLALCGFPFMAGFYSKDLILEMITFSKWNLTSLLMLMLATLLTTMYSLRLSFYSFWSYFHFKSTNSTNDKESPINSAALTMAFLAITIGSIMNWSIFSYPNFIELPILLKTLPVTMIILALLLTSSKFMNQETLKSPSLNSLNFMSQMWFLPKLTSQILLKKTLNLSKLESQLDRGWLEHLSAQGLFTLSMMLSNFNQKMMINNLKSFLLVSISFLFFISTSFILNLPLS